MDIPDLNDRLDRARELLRDIHHPALTTVNPDGSPLCTPVFAALDESLNLYWSSHPGSLHSTNIERDPRTFIVIYDSREGHGGLYMRATAKVISSQDELTHAHQILERLKQGSNHTMGDISRYQSNGPQRLYRAEPKRLWVNYSDRDEQGFVIRDHRHEITLEHLTHPGEE